ncbi:RNA-directed DNA polymerase, eukaryota [Tanacetum coccineum]
MGSQRSKEDDVARISTSIFIMNFPETVSAKDLFNTCKQYGHVVDAYIPFKRSKAGKRFGFVRFINVFSVERLVKNLCTIWIDKHKLYANITRFQRPPVNANISVPVSNGGGKNYKPNAEVYNSLIRNQNSTGFGSSYANVVKDHTQQVSCDSEPPVLVLDDDCVLSKDLSKCLLGRVKEFASLANIKMTLNNEGFMNIKISYMGEMWIMLEFEDIKAMKPFRDNVSIGSWFSQIIQASMDFVTKGRIAWVEIEGIPFKLWSGNTFKRIAAKWGVMLDIEDQEEKIEVFWVRAKETTGWVPDFTEETDEEEHSDVDSKDDNDVEDVPDTMFENEDPIKNHNDVVNDTPVEEPRGHMENHSEDPFGIYTLLNKKNDMNTEDGPSDHTPNYPPGFTPNVTMNEDCTNGENANSQEGSVEVPGVGQKDISTRQGSMKDSPESVCSGHFKKSTVPRTGGSILCLMEELIKVGQTMGYNMDGVLSLAQKAKKDWVKELCIKHKVNFLALQETKMESMDLVTVKMCWGNLGFDYVHSDSVGNSGGILCVWDSNSFRRVSSTVSDYFALIRGVWLKTGKDFLIVSVYAPHDMKEKHMLWDYLSHVILNWKGEVVIMGDFNELEGGFISGRNDKPSTSDKLQAMETAQKAKIKWCIEGDENSSFFHGMLNKKRSQLSIRGIMVNGSWIEDPFMVKREFYHHFSKRFAKPDIQRAHLVMEYPNTITLEQQVDLECEVSKEELKKAVWDCGIDKSPGPDGFTFGFYRRYWNIIEIDVFEAVKCFFNTGTIPNGCNSFFITLIPKIPDANLVNDFRPISLIGSPYKIIAKILANRLIGVLGGIVNEVQSAFIAERQILDGPFILNELFQWCKLKRKQSLIFKVDFEKAFDSVRWDFLDEVLRKFGFGNKWCNWIQSCLRSSRGSILINGSPTEEFSFFKGLKQGDPLSPFLFILIMESLHLSFQRVVDAGMFKGVKLHSSMILTHMFYADDVVFVGQWCDENINTLIHVLECFYRASGMRINMSKSKIMGICVADNKIKSAATNLGCRILKTPFIYLGTKVGDSMARFDAWEEVMNKVYSRLSK